MCVCVCVCVCVLGMQPDIKRALVNCKGSIVFKEASFRRTYPVCSSAQDVGVAF